MIYAHFFKDRGAAYLIVGNKMRPIGKRVNVINKKQARRVVANLNAIAWNF